MFRKIIKRSLSSLLCLTTFLSTSTITFANGYDNNSMLYISNELFTGDIISEEISNLQNIKIDIYTYELEEKNDELEIYRNVFSSSIYTDTKGSYSFARPDSEFLMKVDLSSLPYRSGISEKVVHVGSNDKCKDFEVEYIYSDDIMVNDISSEDVQVNFTSKSGDNLFTDYTTKISPLTVSSDLKELKNLDMLNNLEYRVYVSANGFVDEDKYVINLSKNIKDKINDLSFYGKITDQERISLFAQLLDSDINLSFSEKNDISIDIMNFCINNPSDDNVSKYNEVIDRSLIIPNYKDEQTYSPTGGFFQIHYENGDYSTTTVSNIYSKLSDVKNWYTSNGFLPPKKQSGQIYYHIYLVKTGDANGSTQPFTSGASYIVFKAPTDYTASNINFNKTIAHEMFHAVSFNYTYANNVTPERWFRESFATWASLKYVNTNLSQFKSFADDFLSTPDKSLNTIISGMNRQYGAFLFPLTISEEYGGINTIKNIMEQFGTYSSSFNAILYGLSSTDLSYSISKAFRTCALYNTFPDNYYDLCTGTYIWNDARRVASYTNGISSLNVSLNHMSCKYCDFIPNTSSRYLYVTLDDNNNTYSNIAMCCVKKKCDGSYFKYESTVSSSFTYRFNNFRNTVSNKFTIGLINTKVSGDQQLAFSATYQNS